MDIDDKKRIRANFKNLVDQIRYVDLQDHLYQYDILNDEDVDILNKKNRYESSKAANRQLLRVIQEKGPRAYKVFCDALREEDSEHVVRMLQDTDVSSLDYTDLEPNREEKMGLMTRSLRAQMDLIKFQNEELESLRAQVQEKNSAKMEEKVKELEIAAHNEHGITEENVVAFFRQRMQQDVVDSGVKHSSSMSLLDSYMPVFARQWVDQSAAKGSTESTCQIMGPYIIHYIANSSGKHEPPPNKYAAKMREMVQQIYDGNVKIFEGLIQQLDVTEMDGLQAFANVANEMFEGYDPQKKPVWGYIATLYAFGGYVATCKDSSGSNMEQFIGDFLGFFVSRRLGNDIDKLGGWDAFLDFHRAHSPSVWCTVLHNTFAMTVKVAEKFWQPPDTKL